MRHLPNRAAYVVLPTVAALLLTGARSPRAEAATTPTAVRFGGTPAVGALFSNPTATGAHFCTASVVASATGDTVLTAAHCISGSGTSLSFVPKYHGTVKPYGVWRVTKVYVDPRWKSGQNPRYDAAVLKIARRTISGRSRTVQSVVGAAYRLRAEPAAGSLATIPGYTRGSDDLPLTCTARITYTFGYPGFNCNGYTGGVSGSPFVQVIGGVAYVTGAIGGLHQGGCYASTSYSAPFGSAEQTLLSRAVRNLAGDIAPRPGSDGC